MNPINYQKINQQTINNWIDNGWESGQPISHTEFEEAKNGNFAVKLPCWRELVARAYQEKSL